MRTRVYIAGPIFGRPNNNIEAFARVEDRLRQEGFAPVNPHYVAPWRHGGSCPVGRPGAEGEHTAPCYMRADLIALLQCDGIYLMEGWEQSQGARVEYLVARTAGLAIRYEVEPVDAPSLPDDLVEWFDVIKSANALS